MEPELTTVEIPIADLPVIRAALNSAYHQNTVLDLAEQYRKLSQRPGPSKLTIALENALALNEEHIALTVPVEDIPEDAPDD